MGSLQVVSEPGSDYWGYASTSPVRVDCRGLETFPMSPVDLGSQFHVGSLASMASSTCLMKCSNELSRTLRVSLRKQHWVVTVEYLQQIFMGFGDLEAIHVLGQFPLEVLIQYDSIESAIAARYGCNGLYLDDNCYLLVNFSNQKIGTSPLHIQAEEIEGLCQGLGAMSSLINDFQSSLSSLRREINYDYDSLLMRVKLGMGVAASLQAIDANLGEVNPGENESHFEVSLKNDKVKEPTLFMKDLEDSFPSMVNQFDAQMHVEMSSKVPGKNLVAEDKNVVWKPPTRLLKFQGSFYDEDITSEGHMLLRNDSFAEGNDQQLRNSNDWFEAWNGELNFYKCIHDFSSAISGNQNNHANMCISWGIFMDHKPEMYVPKEVGYPPPRGSDITQFVSIFRSKYFHRRWEKLCRTFKLFRDQLELCIEPHASSLYLLLVKSLGFKEYKIINCFHASDLILHLDCSNGREHNVLVSARVQFCLEDDTFIYWVCLLWIMMAVSALVASFPSLINVLNWDMLPSFSNSYFGVCVKRWLLDHDGHETGVALILPHQWFNSKVQAEEEMWIGLSLLISGKFDARNAAKHFTAANQEISVVQSAPKAQHWSSTDQILEPYLLYPTSDVQCFSHGATQKIADSVDILFQLVFDIVGLVGKLNGELLLKYYGLGAKGSLCGLLEMVLV